MKTLQIIVTVIILGFILFVAYLAIFTNPPPFWTGFGESIKNETKEAAKTLWDWLDLLIIPVAIGLLGWTYNQAEKAKAKKSEEERSQNETLDSFLQIMTKLITENNLQGNPSHQTRAIARARINLAFNKLNGLRKGHVLQFLYESDLIDLNPKIKLLGANLRNVILDEFVLGGSEIRGVYFNNASIQKANLNDTILIGCDFSHANFSRSLVKNLDLSYSNLTKAKLNNMDLTSVNFEGATLDGADIRGSTISNTQLNDMFNKKKLKTSKKNII